MSKNWDRYFRLTVSGSNGNFDLSSFRVKFHIKNVTKQTPGWMEARVYNLSKATRNQIRSQEKVRVILEAGYQDNHGTLFNGLAWQIRDGHETPTETFLDIIAEVGNDAHNVSFTNKTFPANSTQEDVYAHGIKDMQKLDPELKKGYVGVDLKKTKYPQAFTFFGPTKDLFRMLAKSNKATWHIGPTNQLHMIANKRSDALPGGTIKIGSSTGMVGSAIQTYQGVLVRHLIDPRFVPGKYIELDQHDVQEAQYDLSYPGADVSKHKISPEGLSPNGTYRILAIDWVGDTRGTPWYAEMVTYYKVIPIGGEVFVPPPGPVWQP